MCRLAKPAASAGWLVGALRVANKHRSPGFQVMQIDLGKAGRRRWRHQIRRRAAEEAAKETPTPSRTFGAGAMSAKGLGGMSGFAKGGKVGSASKRADGIAMRGKTRGKMV